MRTLAIDLGTVRVGLALSDEGGRYATPLEVVQFTSDEALRSRISKLIEEEGVVRIVVGLPLNMDDSMGPAAKKTVEWGRGLGREVGVPVLFVDERLSSFEAEQQLVARKRAGERLSRQKKKRQLDAMAAAGFLQAFLDGKVGAREV